MLNQELSENNLKVIESFFVLMYDLTSRLMTLNECRRSMFTKKGRRVELIPLTQNALVQHIRRALLQWKYVNFVLTQIENLLYKLNDEVNAGTDPSVPGRPVHPKNDQTNFWKSCSFYPTFNFKLFYFLPHLPLKFELAFAFGNLE